MKPIEERPADWHAEIERRQQELAAAESNVLIPLALLTVLVATVYLFAG